MDHGVIDEFFTFIAGSNAGCIDYVSFSAAMERVPPICARAGERKGASRR